MLKFFTIRRKSKAESKKTNENGRESQERKDSLKEDFTWNIQQPQKIEPLNRTQSFSNKSLANSSRSSIFSTALLTPPRKKRSSFFQSLGNLTLKSSKTQKSDLCLDLDEIEVENNIPEVEAPGFDEFSKNDYKSACEESRKHSNEDLHRVFDESGCHISETSSVKEKVHFEGLPPVKETKIEGVEKAEKNL